MAANNRPPFIGSGRPKEGGFLATTKQDFNAHVSGQGHRQDGYSVDIVIPGLASTNVSAGMNELLELIHSGGTGFISIGDADGYTLGDYNVGAISTPTLFDAFTAAFSDTRLSNGGILLILAGTYTLSSTVVVPPGITIMGEQGGTIIIGETTDLPMFKIKQGVDTIDLGNGTPLLSGSPSDYCKFSGLILIDNLNGTITSSGTPIASLVTVPMIQCEASSALICEDVRFIGKLDTIGGRTLKAIGYTLGGGTGSTLIVERCFFDGMKHAIDFNPGKGELDFLKVDNCRARTYGLVGFGSQDDRANNCFVKFSLCNAQLTNNYHVGAGFVKYCFTMYVAGAYATAPSIVISGNSGSSYVSTASGFFNDTTNTGIKVIQTGNTWGNKAGNDWFVTIGNSLPDVYSNSNNSSGDFVGTNALDVAFAAYSGVYGMMTHFKVQPGTYEVTNGGSSNFFLSGIKKGSVKPTVILKVAGSGSPTTGNRYLSLGGVEAIDFTSNGHTVYESVIIGGQNVYSKDCTFNNACLESGSKNTEVTDCEFYQDNAFVLTNGYLSMYLQATENVQLKRCKFYSSGYAGVITSTTANVTIDSCLFDLTGGSINALSSGLVMDDCYLTTIGKKVTFRDSQFQVSQDETIGAPVTSGMLTVGNFRRMVKISADTFFAENNYVNSPDQAYVTGGISYNVVGWRLEVQKSATIHGNRFINCRTPLQISGTSFTSSTKEGITITNNKFVTDSVVSAHNQLDIDLSIATPSGNTLPYINITGNQFQVEGNSSNFVLPQHVNVTGGSYTGFGIVQLYCNKFDVNFSQNRISSVLKDGPATSGRRITGFFCTSSSGLKVESLHMEGNKINVSSAYVPADSVSTVTAATVLTSDLRCTHNTLNLCKTGSTATGFTGVMDVGLQAASSSSFGDISHNLFSHYAISGSAPGNLNAFINIQAGAKGAVLDNKFTSSTITAILDNNSTSVEKWISDRNVNETKTVSIHASKAFIGSGESDLGGVGIYNTNTYLFGSPADQNASFGIIYQNWITDPAPTFEIITNDPKYTAYLNYPDGQPGRRMWYQVQLSNLIPIGAKITGLSICLRCLNGSISGNMTDGLIYSFLSYNDDSGAIVQDSGDSCNFASDSFEKLTVTPSSTLVNTGTNNIIFLIRDDIDDGLKAPTAGGDRQIYFDFLKVTYRY